MSQRTLTLPLDHLDAELLAAPFGAAAAFGPPAVALDPRLRADSTRQLWRNTERRLAGVFPGLSLDALVARRDRVWFPAPQRRDPTPLADILRGTFDHIARDGIDGTAPAVQRRRMRWLTFALPADLLDVFADAGAPPTPPVAPLISRLLAQGVVEPHLHLGAAVDFETLWVVAQYTLAEPDCPSDAFASPGAVADEGRRLAPWVLRGLIGRAVVAAFLGAGGGVPFERWLDERRGRLRPLDRLALDRVLDALCCGRAPADEPFPGLQALYRLLVGIGPGQAELPGTLDAIRTMDGVARWFPGTVGRSSEQGYVRCGAERIAREPRSRLATLFWQTVRLRVVLYRHVVQRPLVGGLQWFTRAFARVRAVRGGMTRAARAQAAERLGGPGLEGLELRFTPPGDQSTLLKRMRSVAGAVTCPVGIVLHLARGRSDRAHDLGMPPARGVGTHGEPTRGQPFRYGHYYRARLAEARAIIDLLRTRPRAVEWLRGIDVCGDELAIPLWVLAPLLGEIRRVGRLAAERVAGQRCAVTAPRLLVHAGEDYVHLLGGLRRLDEFVEYLDLGEGDRVAHALALGEDVDRWCGAALGRVQAREERLLDLLWVWRRLAEEPSGALVAWGTWVELQLRRLIGLVFGPDERGSDYSIERVQAAHALLYDPRGLALTGFPFGVISPILDNPTFTLARRWLTDRGVFHRGRVVEEVEPRRIVALIDGMQSRVRERLSQRSIAIEMNPSSNLLIGGFGDLTQHPLWRLRPVKPDARPSVMVCIGSDDPITFGTRLPMEYQLVYDTLVEAGISSDAALGWLDDARRTSQLVSVIPARSPGGNPSMLDDWPETLAPIPPRALPG